MNKTAPRKKPNLGRRKIGILTGGGDCPGLNAVIRAVVKTCSHQLGIEVVGFLDGFKGLVEDRTRLVTYDNVSNILTQGGTILGTSSNDHYFGIAPHKISTAQAQAHLRRSKEVFARHQLECLICIGGDGTLTLANHLQRNGLNIIGVPKTIDNDVAGTDQTFGFNTACAIATEAIDRLHTTAASHHRVMVLEVMGRKAGWIALHAGVAGGGDVILIPEIPFKLKDIYRRLVTRSRSGRRFSIVVVAEGCGQAPELSKNIQRKTGLESRATVLGHLQRGGTPTPFDRLLATQFGHAAALLAAERKYGVMVSLQCGEVGSVGLDQVAGKTRRVSPDSALVAAARAVGTSFGE